MPKPVIAIVGKPNVGKSALFNRLARRRIAIVDSTPGVTRDRLCADIEVFDRKCLLIDTGGLDPGAKEELTAKVADQVQVAIEEADVIVFVVDGQGGLSLQDFEIAKLLRKSGKPLVFVANKVDHDGIEPPEVHELRLGEPLKVSALQNRGIRQLLEELHKRLPPPTDDKSRITNHESRIRLAIVGRPNVGKSALLNAILGEERVIVSEMPGTTRDAIDTPFEWKGQNLVLIDTAGLRRKARIKHRLDYYSVVRSLGAIDRCDVALLVMDAVEGVTNQDAKIGGYAHESGKPTVIIVNKWDLVASKLAEDSPNEKELRRREKILQSDFEKALHHELGFMDYAPVVYTSALHGSGIEEMLEKALHAYEQSGKRIGTGALNRLLQDITSEHPPPLHKGKPLKIYYATQPQTNPPTFVLFVNDPQRMHFSYLRHLENRFRERLSLDATPLRFVLRASHEGKKAV